MKTLLLSGNSPPLSHSVAGGSVPDIAAALVHSVEEERDELRLRQTELSHTLKQLEAENTELRSTVSTLRDALHAAEGHFKSAEDELKVSSHASTCTDLLVYHVVVCYQIWTDIQNQCFVEKSIKIMFSIYFLVSCCSSVL